MFKNYCTNTYFGGGVMHRYLSAANAQKSLSPFCLTTLARQPVITVIKGNVSHQVESGKLCHFLISYPCYRYTQYFFLKVNHHCCQALRHFLGETRTMCWVEPMPLFLQHCDTLRRAGMCTGKGLDGVLYGQRNDACIALFKLVELDEQRGHRSWVIHAGRVA